MKKIEILAEKMKQNVFKEYYTVRALTDGFK